MRFCSGVTLAKIYPNPGKIETYKLSLVITTSEGFGIFSDCVILLGILDTEVVLDYYTFSTVS